MPWKLWTGLDDKEARELRQKVCDIGVRPRLCRSKGERDEDKVRILLRHRERVARLSGLVFAAAQKLGRLDYTLRSGEQKHISLAELGLTTKHISAIFNPIPVGQGKTDATKFMQGDPGKRLSPEDIEQKTRQAIHFIVTGARLHAGPISASDAHDDQWDIMPSKVAIDVAGEIDHCFFGGSEGEFFNDSRMHWTSPFSLSELATTFSWCAAEAALGRHVSITYYSGRSPFLSNLGGVSASNNIREALEGVMNHQGEVRMIYPEDLKENRDHVASLGKTRGGKNDVRKISIGIKTIHELMLSPNHQWIHIQSAARTTLLFVRNLAKVPDKERMDAPLTLSCSTRAEIDRFEEWIKNLFS